MWDVAAGVAAALLLACAGAGDVQPEPCPAGCVCARGLQLEYQCDGLQAALQPGDFLHLQCERDGALEPAAALPALAPPAPAPAVPEVRLADCLPPRAGWPAALRALALTNVTRLVLRAPAEPAASWAAADFAGLGVLDALTLEGGGAADSALLGAARARRLTLRRLRVAAGALPLSAAAGEHLHMLELGDVQLDALPERAFAAAPGLRALVVWGGARAGGLHVAARSLGGAGALTAVQVQRVPLGALPAGWLGAMPALHTVRLVRCGLAAVPDDLLAGSAALRQLSLAGNALAALPAALLAGLARLERLELQDNALLTLPPALLTPARSLLRLDLSNNNLTQIHQSTFSSQSELQTLSMNHNNLTFEQCFPVPPARDDGDFGAFSPPSPLAPLRGLRELLLSHNRLSGVCDDWRLGLPRLHRLDLSHNLLHTLTDADVNFVLGGNETLELDLRYNNISLVLLSSVDPTALDRVAARAADSEPPPAARVLLAGNPLLCDCRLHELLRRAAAPAGTRYELAGTRCAAPPALVGRAPGPGLAPLLACELVPPSCPHACACALRPGLRAGLLALDCAAPPPPATWPLPAHYGLPAAALRLTAPPVAPLHLPPHLALLNLTALNLTALDLVALNLTALDMTGGGLELLDLSDNLLETLPSALAGPEGAGLLLRGNPLRCECAHAGTLAALQRSAARVQDWAALRCADGAPLSAARVAPCPAAGWRLLAGLGALATLLALGAALVSLRFARELRGWAAARGLACCWPADPAGEDAPAPGLQYDAFVSYAHGDERWVVSELVPRLERAGLRLCLHFRDWEAGGWIPAQIERSVRCSARTLLVVSPQYLGSEWARHEWRAALAQPRPRLVLVLLGELPAGGAGLAPELRAHMQRHTYVRAGDPWFWSKLRVALPRRSVAPASPAEQRRRDVTKKLTFDDRLDALCAAPAPGPAPPAPAAAALLARLEPGAGALHV